MKNEFGLTWAVKWDRKADRTHVDVKFSAQVFRDPNNGNEEWEKYVADCRQSLHRVAAAHSVEILVWSIDLDWEDELTVITHHVYARGLLPGATEIRIVRALKPARGYAALDFLAQAVKQGLPVDPLLERAVESQRLQRYDRKKPLAASLKTQLLALALTGSGWRRLISPYDKPWAYINQTTQFIYERNYEEKAADSTLVAGLSPKQIYQRSQRARAGSQLAVESLADVVQNGDCTADVASILAAREAGKKWKELPEYLTELTGTPWERWRVKGARTLFATQKDKLRAAARAGFQWKPGSNQGNIYRQRLRGGGWTYSHSLQGKDLEMYREVMLAERKNLFRASNPSSTDKDSA
jgi:hypothetical protein